VNKIFKLDEKELKRMGFDEQGSARWAWTLRLGVSLVVDAKTGKGILHVDSSQVVVAFLGYSHLKWFLEALDGGVYFKKHAWRER